MPLKFERLSLKNKEIVNTPIVNSHVIKLTVIILKPNKNKIFNINSRESLNLGRN